VPREEVFELGGMELECGITLHGSARVLAPPLFVALD
jgi:hypothetical protein